MKIFITILLLVIIGLGVHFLFIRDTGETIDDVVDNNQTSTTTDQTQIEVDETKTLLGQSVNGNEITAYHFGKGNDEIIFVGGIHGGYSWNTALVSYELMDYLEENPEVIPENVKVTVVPVLNPDGLEEVVGTTGRFSKSNVPASRNETIPGRFNGNEVDLNRNFDCDWKTNARWQNRDVSGGTASFSEPEALAIRDYVLDNDPKAVVVFYSSAGGVFASSCHNGILSETREITNVYAKASGYKAYEEFDFYSITGDMVNWLAKEKIPAISVLLTTHDDVEWDENRAGIEALLEHYSTETESDSQE